MAQTGRHYYNDSTISIVLIIIFVRELLELEPVSLVNKRGRLRWIGHTERKDHDNWEKHCMSMETNGTR